MPNPHLSTQDWFYHAPAAKTQGPACVVAAPSQIPGLSNILEDSATDHDDRHFRRKWIRDTDSKYVKLAKAGGRKHLLTFNAGSTLSSEPVLYPRVDWFDHHVSGREAEQQRNESKNCAVLPEWYVHEQPHDHDVDVPKEDGSAATNLAGKRPMLGFDSMSVWQRENQPVRKDPCVSKSLRLPKIGKKKISTTKPSKELVKLPKLKSDLSDHDGTQEMRKLLSMDYQREWLLNKGLEDTKEMKFKQKIQKEKHEREKRIASRHRQSLKPKKAISEEKPLFKLSRFNKVKSCVDSRWSKLKTEDKSVEDEVARK